MSEIVSQLAAEQGELSEDQKRDLRITGFRLNTGEFLIAELNPNGQQNGMIEVLFPFVLEMRPGSSRDETLKLGLGIYCPFSADQVIALSSAQVQSLFNPQNNLVETYKAAVTQMTTGLVVPKKSGILLG